MSKAFFGYKKIESEYDKKLVNKEKGKWKVDIKRGAYEGDIQTTDGSN